MPSEGRLARTSCVVDRKKGGAVVGGRRGDGRTPRARGAPGRGPPADLAGTFYGLAGDFYKGRQEAAEVHAEQPPALLAVLGRPAGRDRQGAWHHLSGAGTAVLRAST